ncbi:protein-L-isoaspartate(D-aspartate) O-methyltransferase [Agaribacterium haliotis]|uniref:protein-L-isoaspartate(D-aspartate) O-methyltransferase n=1 Tax=Agaribacterium haliotis TaxID=2013869 RepID=UPI000BB56055|nr:protein-L-isoaspartate(D-aspartate) O-methyltransferase [Agaribacterium haliotis]
MTSKRTRDRLVARLQEQGVTDQAVLDVVANTPRHLFIDEALSHRAYEDTALPIGFGQTISQPYIVARMTELVLAAAAEPKNVLEIGTGCGYQTAVLAQLVPKVFSVERIKPLQDKAKQRLKGLGIRNVEYRYADGGFGWPERELSFDAILSAAAPRSLPQSLCDQLAPGGVLVIPIGADTQELTVVIRDREDTDKFHKQVYEAVKFVPLLSGLA